ncbi:MAG: tetratricopeptide repeat protein [Mariprofundaceae bacterium]|nr:tetratricopeptide repeat protein [Mariprofundaceae bacterium]
MNTELSVDLDDLKRDVQSAQIQAWLRKHQQLLTVGVVVLLLMATGASLWNERLSSQREAAASLYYQGVAQTDLEKKQVVFSDIIKDYSNTAYGLLARLQLAVLVENPEPIYQSLIDDKTISQIFRWQARLDLAEYYISQDKLDHAKALLSIRLGKQYEQLRYYLLASISDGAAKKDYLQKSLDAESNDALLKDKVSSLLGQSIATKE